MLFSGALEDTFRIPSADSIGSDRRRRTALRSNRELSTDEDGEGLVVIPPLGDREVDDDIWRLFQRSRAQIAPRSSAATLNDTAADSTISRHLEDGTEESMDVDELETDCISSHTPSRASSPAPDSNVRTSSSSQSLAQPAPTQSTSSSVSRLDAVRRASLLERRESSSPYMAHRGSSQTLRRNRRLAESTDVDIDVDLAGTCFDPSGEYIYAASVRGISEWRVRGAEQTWWNDFTWA
jgi:hypothetical protein